MSALVKRMALRVDLQFEWSFRLRLSSRGLITPSLPTLSIASADHPGPTSSSFAGGDVAQPGRWALEFGDRLGMLSDLLDEEVGGLVHALLR